MNRITRAACALAIGGLVATAGGVAHGQCDPNAGWRVYSPTGDISEILVDGEIAWVAADGGIIRIDLSQIASENPEQIKITDEDGLASPLVTCMTRDGLGNFWVGTRENGISIFDRFGQHLMDLSSFEELWSDRVIALDSRGDRVVAVSVDEFSSSGARIGGGYVILTVSPENGLTVEPASGNSVEVAQAVLIEDEGIWFGTSGLGLYYRDETVAPAAFTQVLTASGEGLLSDNVKSLVRAPVFGQSGEWLWIGTSAGIQVYDPGSGTLNVFPVLNGQNIIDLWRDGGTMYVLSELGSSRDLYTIDLNAAPAALVVPRSDCLAATDYVPRDVAVDSAGRVIVGTRQQGFSVRDGLTWICPPSLGPHSPGGADLAYSEDGVLYFCTGDQNRTNPITNGIGIFDGANWSSLTRGDGIAASNMVDVEVWRDGTVWFGSSVSAAQGGINRYHPDSGLLEAYNPEAANVAHRTLGRNVYSIRQDADENLWMVFGQSGGGLSVVDAQTEQITNYPINTIFSGTSELLRDVAFDSRGYLWICSNDQNLSPAQLYVIDTNGTIHDLGDDRIANYSMSTEVEDVGEPFAIAIDSNDRILIGGAEGLAYGEILGGNSLGASWSQIIPTSSQSGGRLPPPYRAIELDWDENWWLGTESQGLVRVTNDLTKWQWYDQLEGCPLPDQSVGGIFSEDDAKVIWVSAATGGLARIDLSAAASAADENRRDVQAFPNPWNPDQDGLLGFAALPIDVPLDLRIWTTAGELVFETLGSLGTRSWDGSNLRGIRAEAGVYLVTAVSADGENTVWEGKVAILR
ncbi:MAG: hypothetical protein KC591_04350 [Gemmatimonadetes bacterium]|nr:hypothetical protein [Gemmatimonadota bacterium]